MFASFLSLQNSPTAEKSGLKKMSFDAGQIICRQKESSLGAYILISGAARGICSAKLKNHHVSTYGHNQFFGFASLVSGSHLNHLTVEAITSCEVIFIPTSNLFSILRNEPSLWQYLLSSLSQEMVSVKNKLKISVNEN